MRPITAATPNPPAAEVRPAPLLAPLALVDEVEGALLDELLAPEEPAGALPVVAELEPPVADGEAAVWEPDGVSVTAVLTQLELVPAATVCRSENAVAPVLSLITEVKLVPVARSTSHVN